SFAAASGRRVDLVLAAESSLVRISGNLPTQPQSSFPVTATASNGNDGDAVDQSVITTGTNFRADKRGLYALENTDLFNLVVIPPYTTAGDIEAQALADTISYVEEKRAVLIMDPPSGWSNLANAVTGAKGASF